MFYRSERKLSFTGFVSLSVAGLAVLGCNGNDNNSNSANPPSACPLPNAKVAGSVVLQATSGAHIAPKLKQYADQGKIDDNTLLPVTIALTPNNESDLDQQLNAIYTPGSASFHKFMSPQEFEGRYAPTMTQIEQAKSFLSSHGLSVSGTSGGGVLIQAIGNVSKINEAFQTEIHQYADSNGKTYFAPAYEPTFPSGLSIRAVHGLDNLAHYKTHAHANANPGASPLSGSGPSGGLSPADIRKAYNIPSSVTGSGQTLALVELDGYSASDISSYERAFSLPTVPLQNVYVDGASGTPGAGQSEVTLDIELMAAVATGASKIMVYEAPNTAQALLDLYGKIASDNAASIVSISWGGPESEQNSAFLGTESFYFKQMAAQGQSIFAASGDSGADDNGSSVGVDDPSSQPFVTAVGGTQLNYSGSYISETTWNNGSPNAGAGGGGISSVWTQPDWQNGVSNSSNQASGSMRNTPDVSLNADPNTGYSIFLQGSWTIYGGTSCAAPLWAAFTALVNQQRATNGLNAIGFVNPLIYAIGKGSRYSSDFHDISDHSTNLVYPAVTGYDDATGWGSFNGTGLFQDLSVDASSNDLSC